MNRNVKVSAAVAAALASGASLAAGPTLTTITGTPRTNTVYVMGSSAIKNALTNSILSNFCGGSANATVVTSNGNNTNFLGIACTPVAGQATNTGNYNVWVRYEGGSVSGYLPIVNQTVANAGTGGTGFPIKEISGAGLTATTVTINGESTNNGIDDSFQFAAGGSFTSVIPDLGIGDVEPSALSLTNNYPSDYCTAIFGPGAAPALFNQAATGTIVDEVYALYVNENSTLFTENPLNLNLETIQNILTRKVSDWSQVFDVAEKPVTTGSLAITIVNREYGSGSKAATDILLAGDACSSANVTSTLFTKSTTQRYFSTGDVLKAANTLAGAITYATIDNAPGGTGSQANLAWVTINSIAPSNLAAAQGNYPFWVEAAFINNATTAGGDSTAVNSIVAGLQNQSTTSALADLDAIPSIVGANGTTFNTCVHLNPANSGLVPSGGGTATVYINPYTRHGHTCGIPAYAATAIP
jgi:hypothetical protein